MFIEFVRSYGGNAVGHISNEPDEIATAYINAGVAKQSSADAHLRASFKSEMEETTRQFQNQLDELARKLTAKPSDGPPSRGLTFDASGAPAEPTADRGVAFNGTITPGEASADRGNACFGEILHMIAAEQSGRYEPEYRTYCHDRLANFYSSAAPNAYDRNGNALGSVQRAGTESVSGGATYGYLIKPNFYGSLFEFAIEDSVIEPAAFQVPIGNMLELRWPALDQYLTPTAGQSAAYAGVQVFRKGENTQRQTSDAKLREITFKVSDLTGYTPLSRDLVMDNYIAADAVVQRLFGRAISWKKDYEFFNGNGVGKPLGFLNSPALLTVTRNTASHIYLEDLQAMIQAMHQSSWGKAIWVASQTTYTELANVRTVINSVATPAFIPSGVLTQDMMQSIASKSSVGSDYLYRGQGTLLGRPIRFTEKLPALGTTGCICLIDPQQYGVATRMGLEVGISEHFLFDTDQIAFRFKIRNDGQPMWLAPYKSADAANTQYSPFVQLTQ